MATLLLIIIYLAFISLGLPDSLLGAAWPVMQPEFAAPIDTAGWLYMIIAAGTIVSSLASGTILKRLGTGNVTFISCLMTAAALLGFSFAPSLLWLVICAVPLGLGAGAVDAGLNNHVATHYKAHHMSWLHCFWGVGATLGPLIMSGFIAGNHDWRSGYTVIAAIQFGLVVLLFVTLPLWKRVSGSLPAGTSVNQDFQEVQEELATKQSVASEKKPSPLRIKGVRLTLVSCLFYCGVEATMGLWGGSFLVNVKNLQPAVAAQWVSLYYSGITVGRLITGFITFRVSSHLLIRTGQLTALAGILLLLLPLPVICSLAGFILIGLGCAPIYPCLLHETPIRFGKENSQFIMGYQMAVAYSGSTLLPPLLGWIASQTTIAIFPFFVAAYIAAMIAGSERINHIMRTRKLNNQA